MAPRRAAAMLARGLRRTYIDPMTKKTTTETATPKPRSETRVDETAPRPTELGGPKGPEPTRFGDWERDGRCVDF
ncbi:MAG: succinate dehydrogenase assembly factor 4 [Pseudomonadota bacterium]